MDDSIHSSVMSMMRKFVLSICTSPISGVNILIPTVVGPQLIARVVSPSPLSEKTRQSLHAVRHFLVSFTRWPRKGNYHELIVLTDERLSMTILCFKNKPFIVEIVIVNIFVLDNHHIPTT